MTKPVAYRFKSPLSKEGQWEYGKEPPIGSRWEIEGLYRVQVNVPRTPWQGLTDDDVNEITKNVIAFKSDVVKFIRETEAKLKDKNT